MTDRERGIKMLLEWKAKNPFRRYNYSQRDGIAHAVIEQNFRFAEGFGSRLTTAARRAIAEWERHRS